MVIYGIGSTVGCLGLNMDATRFGETRGMLVALVPMLLVLAPQRAPLVLANILYRKVALEIHINSLFLSFKAST